MNARQMRIVELVNEDGAVSVSKLTSELYVSEATVRRDLVKLEKLGALKRTYGGATSIMETNRQVPLFVRESMNSFAKNEICRQAAELIQNGNTIFLDGSSTAQYIVRHLTHLKDIVAITYSVKMASLLCENHIKTYCTGGLLMENSLVFTGPEAAAFADNLNIDICFLSCKGLDESGKFTDTSDEETYIRKRFLKNSKTRVFLMTENKIGNTYLHTLCHADEVDYIFTNGTLPSTIQTRIKDK